MTLPINTLKKSICGLVLFSFLFLACNKSTLTSFEQTANLQSIIISELENLKRTSTKLEATKIDTILANLETTEATWITINKTKTLVCRLKTYKNSKSRAYLHTFYLLALQYQVGKSSSTPLIYTIHTSIDENTLTNNIEDILSIRYKNFSGQIVTNALNDKFILAATFVDGRAKNIFEIKPQAKPIGNRINSANNNDNCAHFYLVTTTIWSDGSITREWTFLYSLCGPCNTAGQPVDSFVESCDPQYGGGFANNSDTINPCETARLLETDEVFKSHLDSLKQVSNQNFETGFYSTRSTNGTVSYHKIQGTPGVASGGLSAFSFPTTITGFKHNHTTGLLSVFSPPDIKSMYEWMKNGNMADPLKFTMTLVTANGTAYMLQIDDIDKFQTFGEKHLANATWYTLFETMFRQTYQINTTNSNQEQLVGFLRMLADHQTGLKFFTGNISNFSTWTPKKFEYTSLIDGMVIDDPCN